MKQSFFHIGALISRYDLIQFNKYTVVESYRLTLFSVQFI